MEKLMTSFFNLTQCEFRFAKGGKTEKPDPKPVTGPTPELGADEGATTTNDGGSGSGGNDSPKDGDK